MGIKMNRARYNGQEIKISEYDVNKVYGKLKCYYCDADISFVNSHERDLGERKIIIQKYFRLKRGEEHEKGCKYTVDGAILNIHASCADDVLMSKRDNKYVVRLMLISQDTAKKGSKNLADEPGRGKRQHNYIPSGKKTAYLSTMNQIMKLRALVENNSDLEDKINLQYYDGKGVPYLVSWKDFYFDSENENDFGRLLRCLTNKKVYHPICVVGYIKSISEYQTGKFCIKLETVSDEKNKRVAIAIYYENNQIYEQFKDKNDCKIITYAYFKFYRKNEWIAPDDKKFIYYNITGNVYDIRQMLLLSDDTTV